ncbi:hypothetical protein [Humisphaera borealis]|uniref:Uncharacterized protein n=1 Tax=Humisphaera borealis TaxID=2807512 RepID=A0A7M2X3B7_9BACT|nr:hypothetical protein [Humisphaera borealis]QOV92213.1 hypothetical protein IPV69_12995 [Humisphaera borealis]
MRPTHFRRALQLLAVATCSAFATVGIGQSAPSDPPVRGEPALINPIAPSGPASAGPVLPGAPGSNTLPLGKAFERPSAGISVRPPAGWTAIVEPDREELVRFVDRLDNPAKGQRTDWSLSLIRRSFPKPQHLLQTQVEKDFKKVWEPGIVENTLAALNEQLPGAKILRGGDPTNIGKYDVGMIVMRYTKNGERRLAQHAIIEANPRLYFLLSFNSPGRKDVAEDDRNEEKTVDPTESQAVATFRSIIDSVQLLDLEKIKADQDARLFRTRGLFVNLDGRALNSKLIPQQFMRIIRDGKDIGYSYVVERPDVDPKGGNDGISIDVRSRLMTEINAAGQVLPFPREESEASMFTTLDRRVENWTKMIVFDDGKPKDAKNPWKKLNEVGATQFEQRRVLAADPKVPGKQFQIGENGDPNNPWVNVRESYSLKVEFFGGKANLEPVVRPLPPFYLPQALVSMLPRLIPPNEQKGYMVATYVGDLRQVMARYIDVEAETATPSVISGSSGKLRAIPIRDRIGYEGAPTLHWVTNKGEYLGSTIESTKTSIVPTDEPTIRRIWSIPDGERVFDKIREAAPATVPARGGRPGPTTPSPTGSLPRDLRPNGN